MAPVWTKTWEDLFDDGVVGMSVDAPVGTVTEAAGQLTIAIGAGINGEWWDSTSSQQAPVAYHTIAPTINPVRIEATISTLGILPLSSWKRAGIVLYADRGRFWYFGVYFTGGNWMFEYASTVADSAADELAGVVPVNPNVTPLTLRLEYDPVLDTIKAEYNQGAGWVNWYNTIGDFWGFGVTFVPDKAGLLSCNWGAHPETFSVWDDASYWEFIEPVDIQNPSFEIPDMDYGEADAWTDTQSACSEDIAQFSDGIRPAPYETFDGGWDNNQNFQLAFGLTDLVHALFEAGSHQQEDFETSWKTPNIAAAPIWNHHSVWVYSASNFAYAMFNALADEYEDFEAGWPAGQANPPYNGFPTTPAPAPQGTISAAMFNTGTEAYEAFEQHWQVNQDWEEFFTIDGFPAGPGGGTVDPALFDAGANAYEDFEGVWTLVLI